MNARGHPAFILPVVAVAAIIVVDGERVAAQPCTGGASSCGTWVQIPSCGQEYINCTSGWPAAMKATHMILLRAGDGTARVLMWHASCGYNKQTGKCEGGGQTSYWKPTASSGVPRRLPVTSDGSGKDELFCAGHVVLDDGSVFTAGGTNTQACADTSQAHGLSKAWVFNPASSDTCGQVARDLNPVNGCPDTNWCGDLLSPDVDGQGHCIYAAPGIDKGWRRRTPGDGVSERWYPTCTVLGNGKVLVTSGGTCGTPNPQTALIPEIYDRLATSGAFTAMGSSATTARYPGPWYPFMFALKSNKVFHVGPYLAATIFQHLGSLSRPDARQRC